MIDLSKWREAAARLAAEQAEHDAEWRERRARRAELEQAIAARREELKAIRRAERTKEDAVRSSVARFVEARLAKPVEASDG